ncbi:MAG: bifunctional sulfate adenylyltransferase/adenylylsulfate kinase [Acidobacteria bacterium]|nr:MAG: bifunctional sulfate adenylyltransferase/adenylylsulfate kinase [Acidobacteriota bacterium]
MPNSDILIPPYGGALVDLNPPAEEREELRLRSSMLRSIQVSDRSVCDLELLATGGFSPLDRFMGKSDYQSVLGQMRLANGCLFPVPILLPVDADSKPRLDEEIVLRDSRNLPLAVMRIEEVFPWDLDECAAQFLGTRDERHPLVAEMYRWGKLAVSGPLRLLALPYHPDFRSLRLTPEQVRRDLARRGRPQVVAFQTRNPLHRVHEELTCRAINETDGTLLLHPVVGMTKPGDVDHYTRVRAYMALTSEYYDPERVLLSLLPLAMRLAGPREALWHAIIRRNYGANHLIVGRDHAGPGSDSKGKPFYPPYSAQDLVEQYAGETGVKPIPFTEMVYLPDEDRYEEVSRVEPGVKTMSLSGTQVRDQYLNKGMSLPAWFTRPEVAEILSSRHPARHRQGFCLWFTGLSGAGKSTISEMLTVMLLERGIQVTVLDGDVVRTHLSKGLGFSREDRDTNIRRIGFVAAEIVRHGGRVICAAVSPYRSTRNDARNMVGRENFIEIFVDTPLEVCEQRDTKGMYAKARRGEIKGFTGIDDPYEPPARPELTIKTVEQPPEQAAQSIIEHLVGQGLLLG